MSTDVRTHDMALYNVKSIDGTEPEDYLLKTRDCAIKCVQQVKYPRAANEDYPENWKYILTPWMKEKSPAYDLLFRRDTKTPINFFET